MLLILLFTAIVHWYSGQYFLFFSILYDLYILFNPLRFYINICKNNIEYIKN